jgi:hypothetical protein
VTAVLAVLLFLAAVAGIAGAAAFVGRPIPRSVLFALAFLPLAYFLPDLLLHRTRLPTDQMNLSSASAGPPRNPWLNDVATEFVPWAEKTRVSWLAGEMPFRDWWSGCGSPLSANGQTAAFSPLTLPLVLMPLVEGQGLIAAMRILLGLAGMWLFLRELRCSVAASVFGAVSFAVSYAIVPWVFFPHAGAIALWPWVFFGVERLRDPERPGRALAFLTGVFAVWALLGHVESMVMGGALLAVVLAARWATGDFPDARRVLARAAFAGAAAALLTAFYLLPHALAILASHRRAMVREAIDSAYFSWKPRGFVWAGWRPTLFPGAFGDGIGAPMIGGRRGAFPELSMGFVGTAGWALALLVFRPGSPRSRTTAGLVAGILVSLGIGVGAWPFAEIFGHLPPLGWLVPTRMLAWIALAGSALAALELTRWQADAEKAPGKAAIAAVVSAAVLALLALESRRHYLRVLAQENGKEPRLVLMNLTLLVLAAFALSAVWVAARSPAIRRLVPWAFVLVAAADMTLQARWQYRGGPVSEVFRPTGLSEFLRGRPRPFRIAGEGYEFFPQRHAMIGVEDIRMHDPIERNDYMEFLDATCGYDPADYFKHVRRIEAPVLDFLNVRYVVSYAGRGPIDRYRPVYWVGDGSVFENPHVLPRVFAPRVVEGIEGSPPGSFVANAIPLFPGVLPRLAALADFRERAFVLGAPAGARENGEAEVLDYTELQNRASFRSRARAPAVLVASLIQDGGWRARDETGRRLPTTLANGPFLALTVAQGEHRIVLDYVPPGWRAGVAVSLAGAAGLFAAVLRSRRPRLAV